jgi:hypothetical protein
LELKLFRKVLAVGIIVLFFGISFQPAISRREYIVSKSENRNFRNSTPLRNSISSIRAAFKNNKYRFDENLRINNFMDMFDLEFGENNLINGFCLILYLAMYLLADIIFFIYVIFTDYDTWKIIDIITKILQPLNNIYNYFDCHSILDILTDNSWVNIPNFLGKPKLNDCSCMQE